MKTLLLPLAVMILSLTWNKAAAQEVQDKLEGARPSIILVQLPTEQNRIDALTRSQRPASLEEVKRDAAAVRNNMMRDFTDNFSFCPVFYFLDKDLDKVRDQDFAGVLFDRNGSPIADPGIAPGSKDYVIVRYGRPETQPNATKVIKEPADYDAGEPLGRGLVVYNYKMQQINYITTYEYKRRLLSNQKRKEYYYSSKHFQIAYYPLAKELDAKVPRIYE